MTFQVTDSPMHHAYLLSLKGRANHLTYVGLKFRWGNAYTNISKVILKYQRSFLPLLSGTALLNSLIHKLSRYSVIACLLRP